MKNYTNNPPVPVFSSDGFPLMPCRASRARRLVESGSAVKQWVKGVYCIKMVSRTLAQSSLQDTSLNIDTGSKDTGITVVSDDDDGIRHVLAAIQLKHRSAQIKHSMDQRRAYRRTRCGRLRYRAPRFSNRRRKLGWLPLSLAINLHHTKKWVDILCTLYPIKRINIEYNKFDMQKIVNPNIHGVEYQHGTLYKWQIKNYLLSKYNGTCAYCDRTAGHMEADHVVPRSRNGTNRIDNLVLACHDCNVRKGNTSLAEFIGNDVTRISKIKSGMKQSLVDAAHTNILLPRIVDDLTKQGYDVVTHDAATTAWNRKQLDVPKVHCYDAALLGNVKTIYNLPEKIMIVVPVTRQTHQKAMVDKNGTPRGLQYRDYCRLDKRTRSQTQTPGHGTKQQCYGNQRIRSGDIVKIYHKSGKKFHTGRCTVINSRSVVLVGTKPSISGNIKTARLVAQNRGFVLKYEPVELQKS